MSDISATTKTDSTQINADDLIGSPVTITVTRVVVDLDKDQPVDVHTAETPGKAYRPSKTMRRLLGEAWGNDSSQWVGRSMTLFRNPETKFGKEKWGGIEISAMSHLDKPLTVALIAGRGRKRSFHVEQLQAPQPSVDWQVLIQEAGNDTVALRELWTKARDQNAGQEVLDTIQSIAAAQPQEGAN